ncbi:hypothetical protein [Methanobacterium petrolearium]|uniref:hypothetical protein n=1 Tax=Methanobacterium petrolearium TaxID=710190 RepID=UPI0030815F1F
MGPNPPEKISEGDSNAFISRFTHVVWLPASLTRIESSLPSKISLMALCGFKGVF